MTILYIWVCNVFSVLNWEAGLQHAASNLLFTAHTDLHHGDEQWGWDGQVTVTGMTLVVFWCVSVNAHQEVLVMTLLEVCWGVSGTPVGALWKEKLTSSPFTDFITNEVGHLFTVSSGQVSLVPPLLVPASVTDSGKCSPGWGKSQCTIFLWTHFYCLQFLKAQLKCINPDGKGFCRPVGKLCEDTTIQPWCILFWF